MKVVEQPNIGGFVSGMGETANFKMAVNGPLMRNMLTNIYSNKEKTVVRELMANAFDAHAASSSAEPISVALPASLDPTFVVRDYGVGMSHEFVMELFSTIGHSTKANSNSMTGMFGVGSKSPLAICDTFTVRCFDAPGWNGAPHMHANGKDDLNETGRIRLYAISFNDNDIPQIHHTFDVLPKEKDRIERGGVEVKVPIKPEIRAKVLRGLTEQHFCWFDKAVEFEGAFDEIKGRLFTSVTKLAEDFYLASGDSQNTYGDWNVYVRQGFAVYPADQHLLTDMSAEAKKTLMSLCKHKGRAVMIDLPIGTADVTMARENLQYNATSISNVSTIINERTEAFRKKLVEAVGDARDFRTAFNRLCDGAFTGKINKDDFAGRKAAANLLSLVTREIQDNYDTWHATLPDVEVRQAKLDDDGWRVTDDAGKDVYELVKQRPPKNTPRMEIHFSNAQFPEGKCILHSTKFRSGSCDQWGLQQSISFPLISITYVMTSHIPEWKSRIDKHLQATFSDATDFDGVSVFAVRVPKKLLVEARKFVEDSGVGYYVFEEVDLPEATGTEVKARNYSKTSVYDWQGTAWSDTKVEPDFSKPAYYITRIGITHDCFARHPDKPYAGTFDLKKRFDNYTLGQIIRQATELNYLDSTMPIYRVTENQADKIAKTTPGWIHLVEHVTTQAEPAIINDPYAAFNNSKMMTQHVSQEYNLIRWIDRAFNIKSDNDAMAFDALKKLIEHDESLKYFLATRHAISKHKASTILGTRSESLRALSNALYMSTTGTVATKQREFDALFDHFEKNFAFLAEVVNECENNWRGNNLMRHLGFYVNGYCAAESKNENPAGYYLDLRPVVDVFMESLTKSESIRAKYTV